MSHWLLLLGIVSAASAQTFLAVENGELRLNNEKVFLSGMNIAWQNYGNDFGNGQYACCTGSTLEGYLQNIAAAGGNSVRIWIHTDGYSTPQFDGNGFVTGTDGSNTFIPDLSQYLDVAQSNNILVTLVLWNGATAPSTNYRGLLEDNSKLQSYIDNALVPTVNALKGKVALAAWEIMNEPEGIVTAGQTDSNPCFDTTPLSGSGAGWAASFPMSTLLNFINRQIAAIKAEDPKALATIGSWSELAQTDNFGYRNYYTDSCLVAGGGQGSGTIDFQQIHSYAWQGSYNPTSPLLIPEGDFGLSKPTVVGEFSQSGGDGRDITTMYDWCYTQGYSGAWSWQANGGGENADDFNTQARGLGELAGRNDQAQGGAIDINL